MDVTSSTAAAATGRTAATTGATTETASETSGAVTGDFETFLTLLTTQMKNQDPLKPMDSTEFVAQLASFSAVEQQVRANERLDGILGVLSGGSPAGLAEWIGKEVEVAAKADFTGAPVEVALTPLAGADAATLVVTNDFGQEVARIDVEPDATAATWDGTDGFGHTMAEGRYGFSLEGKIGGTLLGSSDGRVYSTVREVRIADGEARLVVQDGTEVALDEIGGVR